MLGFSKSDRPFSNFEKAVQSVPKSKGPKRILVFNNQGLPILDYGEESGATDRVNDRDSAIGADLVRDIYLRLNDFEGKEPERVAFFYQDQVLTLEKDEPFIFLISWPTTAFKIISGASENYIKRLGRTLHEELT
ncbi:hypothetical protein GF324_05300 [bacterium]|nr:hypothetical protein [bacterium]